jgi:uncharacterized protein (TIGR02646 family)
MLNFRDAHPKRSGKVPLYKSYKRYKPLLKKDFNDRCGYCNDEDSWAGGVRVYQIDHFVPRKHLKTIQESDYSNLVYSCSYCNRKKWDDWPSQDEKVHNDGKVGYIDPCSDDYSNHFRRNQHGEIEHVTELGSYMHKKLNLFLRRHAIIWNLHMLDSQIQELGELKAKGLFNTKHEKEFSILLADYHKYTNDLRKANNE